MVINHLLAGMTLQAGKPPFSEKRNYTPPEV